MSMIAPVLLRESELSALAAVLIPLLRAGDVLCLEGDLGAGKTALARAMIRAATDPDTEVPSPTFTLVQTYDDARPAPIWHFDLYRLKHADEVLEIGWEEARQSAISLVEWPAQLGPFRPAARLDIALAAVSGCDDMRQITLTPHDSWHDRLNALGPFFATLKAA